MVDNTDNIILHHLHKIDGKVDRLIDDVGDLKRRMTGVEEALAGQSRRLDRLEERVERIERRLDPAEAPAE